MNRLTNRELKHIEISQAWLDLFLRLAWKHSDITEWRIGGWTSNMIKTFLSYLSNHEDIEFDATYTSFDALKKITEDDRIRKVKKIKMLINWEGVAGTGAVNQSQKKAISIINTNKNWDKNYAYTEIWDAECLGAIRLCFIGKYNNISFKEFEDLFILFINAKTDLEINTFEKYIENKYK